ncbi:protein GET1 [Cryptomeria japonica]|uniref:protein GET1 n=1 Tax=Cryptomeria japonica TaxID=3369 RepID=UPI0025AC5764|nr:protein GET1 [Cryptomeria japonica]
MDDWKHVQATAAPFIFAVIFILNVVSNRFFHMKKKVATNLEEVQAMQEIKHLLKEANSLSTPSTFAQATLLRRAAAAKEKELLEIRQKFSKDTCLSYNLQTMALSVLKVCIYLGFAWWFWGVPVAGISIDLLQPFGNALSWRLASNENRLVMIGIIPWLLLTTRVSAFVSHKLISK